MHALQIIAIIFPVFNKRETQYTIFLSLMLLPVVIQLFISVLIYRWIGPEQYYPCTSSSSEQQQHPPEYKPKL
jgi:ABC-type sugar transport system permease subunit